MLEVGKKKEDIADLDGFRLLTGKSSLQLHPPIPIDISSLPPDILNITTPDMPAPSWIWSFSMDYISELFLETIIEY